MEEGKINLKKGNKVSAFSMQILSDWNDPLIFQFPLIWVRESSRSPD